MSVVSLGELLIDFVACESGVSVGEASGFLKAHGGARANVAGWVVLGGRPEAVLGTERGEWFCRYFGGFFV